jgi:hypothetical protein
LDFDGLKGKYEIENEFKGAGENESTVILEEQ